MEWNHKNLLQWDWENLGFISTKGRELSNSTEQSEWREGSGEIYNGSMYSPDRGTYSDSDLFNDWPKNSMVNSVRSLSVGKAISKVNPEAPEGDLKNLIKNKNQEIGGYICTWEPPIGLKLGKRTYFEKNYSTSMSIIPSGASVKRSRETQQASQRSYCQVEWRNIDLMAAKEYYRKHRVCVNHSRSPRVIVAGHERRFYQQCSRGLSDHNAQPESSRLCPDAYDDTRHKDFYLNLAPLSQIKHLSSTSPLWDQSQCFSSSNNVLQDEFNWLKPFKIATTEVFNQGREACVAASNLNGAPDLQRVLSLLSADTWCPSSAAQSKTIQLARSNPTSLLHSPSQAVWQDYHWLAFNLYSSGGSHVEELQLSKVPFETALFEAT